MTASPYMRVLGGDERTELKLSQDHDPFMVDVPGFGVMIVGAARSNEPIVRLVPAEWWALVVQPDSTGHFSRKSATHPREVKVTDEALEIELYPGHDGERLVVVIPLEIVQ